MRCAFLFLLLSLPAVAAPPDLVAKTEALSPQDELKAFKLPPGFEAQLVASEPDIQKPMQMAFDTNGRLWVCTSHHYPFAAETGKGTDRLYVLSEFDAKGKAGKVEIYDDKLNIPIGVLPLNDGTVIVSEVGRILKLSGYEKALKREVLFDGFGTRDTHGMTNSFTQMSDGWIYACHGYLNDSTVKGKDGHTITMNSGHTFRFRPDGSRIEIFTKGQVNPFGMCTDPWYNLYTADCHSRPMTQLIRGACYDSFGKPHDGLGYAPHVINHMHGSTGLCGIVYYYADYYPKEWQDVMFVGNVVTSTINCDRIEWRGSTPVGKEKPDFLVSSDPWFRPVDIKLGPDGALYVSDFYNKIIGHYEVDLRHPGRDKDRGRIWRIVRTDQAPPAKAKLRNPSADVILGRGLSSRTDWDTDLRKLVLSVYLRSRDPRTQRITVEGINGNLHADFVEPLLELIPTIPPDDTHMIMAARIALRNCVQAVGVEKVSKDLQAEKAATLFGVAIAIRTPESAKFLAAHIGDKSIEQSQRISAAEVIGQFQPELAVNVLDSVGNLHDVAQAVMRGLQAGGVKKLPDGVPDKINAIIATSFRAPTSEWNSTAATLKLATSFPESAATFESLSGTQTALAKFQSTSTPPNTRANLAEAIFNIPSKTIQDALRKALADPNEPLVLRSRLIGLVMAKPTAENRTLAKEMLKNAPYAFAVTIAAAMAGDAAGAETLFASVKSGEAPARLLQERTVVNRLRAAKVPNLDAKLSELTKNLPSAEKRIDDLIKARAAGFKNAKTDVKLGKELFAKHCAVCHQLNNEGTKIGPHLDGVGIRGLERLLEDTIDPNRNVDVAFRATKLDLKDGRSVTGLLLREEGAVYVLADPLGKEVRIPKGDVDEKTTLAQSAMPGNLDTSIPESDYYHLIAYLLEQKQKK